MRLIYLIPVLNEEDQVEKLVQRIFAQLSRQADVSIWLVDNGSDDATWAQIQGQVFKNPKFVFGIKLEQRGQGLAFRAAMKALVEQQIPPEAWVICSAVDLPFGFSDIEPILNHQLKADLIIGSKAHPKSKVPRGFLRSLMSWGYRILRYLILGMKVGDPQGSLIFKASKLSAFERCVSSNYFFSTEFVYFMEKSGASIVEVPVMLEPDFRPSRVRPIQDSFRIFKQILNFGLKNGRIYSRPKPKYY